MTIEEFASILHAKKISKGSWSALCPAHPDRSPSLGIWRGDNRRGPQQIMFKCMSQGCSQESILNAVGLSWKDLMGEGEVPPEVKERLKDQARLRRLEGRWIAYEMLKVIGWENHAYWAAAERKTDEEIEALKDKLDPARARERKMKAAIAKYGWDAIWARFLKTDKGKSLSERYSRECKP
jgi:hypothetical protein